MLYGTGVADPPLTGDDGIVREAYDHWIACKEWQSTEDERTREDIKFANGDSRNAWQWPSGVYARRTGDGKDLPCLTINKTRMHNDIIINSMQKNAFGVKVRPVGGIASYKSAQIMQSIIRRIESESRASSQYRRVAEQQVDGGIGYITIETAYVSERSFDQDIYLKASRDSTAVYLDPWIKEPDGSDANFGFIFERMPRRIFNRRYPDMKEQVAASPLASTLTQWVSDKEILLVKYFRKSQKKDTLVAWKGADGIDVEKLASEIRKESGKEILDRLLDDIEEGRVNGKTRSVENNQIEWFLIGGTNIIERGDWAGRYIPICRCVGREMVVDATLDRKGHTRPLIDAQRMLNYNAPLSLSTPLPTPNGWTTMGDVQTGDWLLNENGMPVPVAGTSPVFLHRKCYRIQFDSGESIIADADHKWSVEERVGRVAAGIQWIDKIVTTKQLETNKHFIHAANLFQLPEADLAIHPYVLGAWLGNGHSATGRLTCHSDDIEDMRENISACGYLVSEASVYTERKAAHITVYGLQSRLRELRLLGDKRIPKEYLRASQEQRYALLQGLMDTDGCLSKAKQCVFSNTNIAIAVGIIELLASLGIKAQRQVIRASRRMFPQGRECECQETHRIAFSADPDVPVFRLSRKSSRHGEPRPTHWRRTKRHRIVKIKEIASVPVKCVAINSCSHLFLAGSTMIPTHNSTSVQIVALQPKAPWLAPARAIEGQEAWKTANIDNFAVLTYNDIDDEAPVEMQKVEAPQRINPPPPSQAHDQGMQTAERQMMMISGQFQAQLGEEDMQSAASGKAISERQQQGDTATYHFVEHFSDMKRFIGIQLLDLIPKIYDTERVLQIIGENNDKYWIRINPSQTNAIEDMQQATQEEEAVKLTFNPAVGDYQCVSDPGPDYATQRQEAWNAMSMLLAQNKELAACCADLLFKYGDFPGADELQERLKKEIKATKPYLFDQRIDPQVQALQQQGQRLVALNSELMTKLADANLRQRGREEKRDIEAYNADTNRMRAQIEYLTKVMLTPAQQAQMQHDVEQQSSQHVFNLIEAANQGNIDAMNSPPGRGMNGGTNGQQ
jgi:hypothetical protein